MQKQSSFDVPLVRSQRQRSGSALLLDLPGLPDHRDLGHEHELRDRRAAVRRVQRRTALQADAGVSVFVSCNTQDEVDALWDRFMAAGGTESKCGWLVDKFGLSWQIIPKQLLELMSDPDP